MAKRKENEEALRLRMLGWSYSAIRAKVGVAKSTLSYWLRDYPLTKKQIYSLQHSEAAKEKFRETMRKKKEAAFQLALDEQGVIIGSLSERDLYLCGLGLFWAEGGKTQYSEIAFSNTDPRMIRFVLVWLEKCLKYPREKIRIRLHLYSDMDVQEETDYWSNILDIPRCFFSKPYVKNSRLSQLTYKTRGHGTCNVRAGGLKYSRPVFAGMETLSRMY